MTTAWPTSIPWAAITQRSAGRPACDMSLFSKFRGWFSRGSQAEAPPLVEETVIHRTALSPDVVARYEGSYQYYGERSLLPATLQDAKFDATPGVRQELQRRSRYWERNSGIYQRLCDLFEQYTVGSNGLRIIPKTDDDNWDARYSAVWEKFTRQPEIDSFRHFGETQSLCARQWAVD